MRDPFLFRDIAIQAGGVIALGILFQQFGDEIELRWRWAVVGGVVVALNALIKLAIPAHAILKLVSWTYLALTFGLLVGGGLLLGDWRILGLWTAPALIGVAALYWLVHTRLGPRSRDDGAGDER